MNLADCLIGMELTPYEAGRAALPLPHPFSLLVEMNGRVDTISLTEEKVTVNGVDYSPAKPEILAGFLEEEHDRFLTGDPYLLQTEMPFTDDDVREITLTELENYSDGERTVVTRNSQHISRIVTALNRTVARRFEADDEPASHAGIGGNAYTCKLSLADGGMWVIQPNGYTVVTTPFGKEEILVLDMKHEEVFGLLEKNTAIPQLTADIENMQPTVFESAYQTPDTMKSRNNTVPVDMLHWDIDPVLSPKESYRCELSWSGTAPALITATVYAAGAESWEQSADGQPLTVSGTALILPGGEGKRYVTVRTEFAGGAWTEHVFSYRSSVFPATFYDVEYGNAEGDVTLTRQDIGVSVKGTQNRKYVDFILSLGLTPSDEPQKLPLIRKPFSMRFDCGGVLYEFIFSTEDGVTMFSEADGNGQRCAVADLDAVAALYEVDLDDLNTFDRINTDMRGFLTKDVAGFLDAFPLSMDVAKSFRVVEERPEERIIHDQRGYSSQEIWDILSFVVLGKGWREEDPYVLRRFYFSYEITLEDGTTYTIGERVLKNSEDTGWYTIQSDSPSAEAAIEGREGAVEKRDKPVGGSITVHDDGTFEMG